VPCLALGTVATGFLESTVFLSALSLTPVLVDLVDFFSDFFSAFFSGLAMLKTEVKELEGSVGVNKIKFGDGRALRQQGPDLPNRHVSSSCQSTSTGNGNVGIGGKL
jgi:hypothetical protein